MSIDQTPAAAATMRSEQDLLPDGVLRRRHRSAEPVLQLRGLSKSYGSVHAVDRVDLEVGQSELVAVLGPNGAGKSTITEMITGLVRPDAGSISVFGGPPRRAVEAGRVGAMLQAGALLHDATVADLLAMMHGLHRRPMPIGVVIELADLRSFLKTRTDKLSGGQAQRVRFALAVMADPELLILDEPTVGMDVEMRRDFWATMRRLAGDGRTVLFATHYLDEADRIADRIVVLDHGRVIADGTAAEIKSRVAGRTITLAADGVAADQLAVLPAVIGVERQGSRFVLRSTDSDRSLRALLTGQPAAREIEVASARLEDAFVALTGHDHDQQPAVRQPLPAEPIGARR